MSKELVTKNHQSHTSLLENKISFTVLHIFRVLKNDSTQ